MVNPAQDGEAHHEPVSRNYRVRKKLCRPPTLMKRKLKWPATPRTEIGTKKWVREQFNRKNFTNLANSSDISPTLSFIRRDCAFNAPTVLENVNVNGPCKEKTKSVITTMAGGKMIKLKPYKIIICTVLRIAVLDRITTSLRSGKSVDVHIDSFSNQWDKSQLHQNVTLVKSTSSSTGQGHLTGRRQS